MFRSSNPGPSSQDGQTYIPPHIEGAMAEHVQQNLPPHLQKYRGGNTYIPQHAQAEIAEHLESTLPPHMQQYAGAYLQQRIVEPSLTRRGAVAAAPAPPEAVPGAETVSAVPGAAVNPIVNPAAPVQQPVPGQSVTPVVAPGTRTVAPAAPTPSPDQAYAFITNPATPPKQPFLAGFLSGKSVLVKAGMGVGALLVLLILFSILRSILGGGPNLSSVLTVAQEQQELIHLTKSAGQQQSLSAGTQNLAATIQASLQSSQGDTISYMTKNGQKIKASQLNLKISSATDSELQQAASAGNYNQVFRDTIEAQLNAYGNSLNSAYSQVKGTKGRALLRENYRQLQLYQVQFKETANQ